MYKEIFKTGVLIGIAVLVGSITTYAGVLTPPGAPASTMYTLDDIYGKLTDFTDSATLGSGSFVTPGSVSATFHTLTEIYTLLEAEDSDLIAGNIKDGTTIFGVLGTLEEGFALEGRPLKSNQTQCWNAAGSLITCAGTGQDGEFQYGVAQSYTDNGNGTITDNTTGLIWQKQDDASGPTWEAALTYCNANTPALPGSGWRLPNVRELTSIVDYNRSSPSINPVFTGTGNVRYWTSSSSFGALTNAHVVNFTDGTVSVWLKAGGSRVRCVRG